MTIRNGNAYFKTVDTPVTGDMLVYCDVCVTWVYDSSNLRDLQGSTNEKVYYFMGR